MTFGGNGALHGPLLADEVGINSVIVPAAPSVFCACGGVVTTLTHDVVNVIQGTTITHESLSDAFRHLASETVDWLKQQVELDRLTSIDHEFWAELRYKRAVIPGSGRRPDQSRWQLPGSGNDFRSLP
uniref:hydantoinase/oxoprolinase family protein n=1 Tax=Agrobacterium fabrum TaxID=1176649 RepID=UPI0021BDB7BA|nr:hydantoinase/oxoprolinase family protein [Agrobacterium fabrum]